MVLSLSHSFLNVILHYCQCKKTGKSKKINPFFANKHINYKGHTLPFFLASFHGGGY